MCERSHNGEGEQVQQQGHPRILAFGDNVVDCYRGLNVMYPGGNCVNHAVFARRFGADAAYAGAVSDDPAGHAIIEALKQRDVDVSLLRVLPGETAYCVIANEDGERVFVGASLGVSIIAPGPADLRRMAEVDAVHTGLSSHLDAWLPKMARLTRISYDFGPLHGQDRIAAVAPHCYLVSFSGGGLSRREALALALAALAAGAQWVLVTRGGEGASLAHASGIAEAPAVPVQPVDTLGAGDTFIARTLVGLLRGEEPQAILAAAAEAAAETCLSPGAFGGGVPLDVDLSHAMSLAEIYSTDRSPPPPPDDHEAPVQEGGAVGPEPRAPTACAPR